MLMRALLNMLRGWNGLRAIVVFLIGVLAAQAGCIPDPNPAATPADDTRALLASLDLTTNAAAPAVAPALSPRFDPKVSNYSVIVPNGATAITIKAVPADPSHTNLKVDNKAVPSNEPYLVDQLVVGATRPVVIVAEETGAGGFVRTYTVQVTRAASPLADLAALATSAGALAPGFDPQQTTYTVKAGSTTTTATITAVAIESTARVSINGQAVAAGQAFGPANLAVGSNPFTIAVTPASGAPKQYSLVIIRGASGVADLASLSLSAGTLSPNFGADITAYTVSTQNATTQTTVSALPAEATAKLTINGQAVTNGQPSASIPLAIGTTDIPIVVTAADGTAKNYSVKVTRPKSNNNNLQNLAVSAGALSPAFSPATISYSLAVSSATTATTVTATVEDPTATMTVNGAPVSSGQTSPAIPLAVGPNAIPIVVTAQNGAAKTYTVSIARNANPNLAGLTLSAGALSPAFAEGTTSYTVGAPNATAATTVTATLADSTSTMTINGQAVASGQTFGPVPLVVTQPNTFTIVVTAAGAAATKTYTVAVTRAASSNADLSGLQVSPGIMSPAFSSGGTSYSVTGVGLFSPSVVIVATVADPTATLTVDGQAATSGTPVPVPVGLFTPTTIPIVVRAQDTVTVKTYTVSAIRP